jgi:mono/diheme cytochrome c family protein
MAGDTLFHEPLIATVVAPDLTRIMAEWDVEEIERAVRHGVRRNGRSTLVMPSSMYYHMSDEDLGDILAFARAQAPGNGSEGLMRVGPLARFGIVMGKYTPQAMLIDHDAPRYTVTDTTDLVAYGKYLALTSCTECHGTDLRGGTDPPGVDLVMVAAYPIDDFRTLMKTGVPLGGRELDYMVTVANSRLQYLTEKEVTSLHAYLQTLAR